MGRQGQCNSNSHKRPEHWSCLVDQRTDYTVPGTDASSLQALRHVPTWSPKHRYGYTAAGSSHKRWAQQRTPYVGPHQIVWIRWFVLTVIVATVSLPIGMGVDASSHFQNPSTQYSSDRRQDRMQMVERQLLTRGIRDPHVITAMQEVPRERFVPTDQHQRAYQDRPLAIGYQQTISQPYIVAYMTQALQLTPSSRVLEVGTGSGYQAAILGEIASAVYSIEIVPQLFERASNILTELGYDNVHVQQGDGYAGWPNEAPFDAIIVTAAPDHVPQPLIEQLAVGGRMIIPVGEDQQALTEITRTETGVTEATTLPVLFVPMTGQAKQR